MAEEMEDFLSEEESETESGTESEEELEPHMASSMSAHGQAGQSNSGTSDVEKQQEAVRRLSELKNEECEIFKYLDKNLKETLEGMRGKDQSVVQPVGKTPKPEEPPKPPPPPPPRKKSEAAVAPISQVASVSMAVETIRTLSTLTKVSTAPPPEDPAWGGYPLRQLMPVLYAGGFWLVYCANAIRAFVPVP